MKEENTNWEAIAREMAEQLNMALVQLKPTNDWTGTLYNRKTGKTYSWEDSFIESIEKIPGYKVDLRYVDAKFLPKKQRDAAYKKLWDEAQNKKENDHVQNTQTS